MVLYLYRIDLQCTRCTVKANQWALTGSLPPSTRDSFAPLSFTIWEMVQLHSTTVYARQNAQTLATKVHSLVWAYILNIRSRLPLRSHSAKQPYCINTQNTNIRTMNQNNLRPQILMLLLICILGWTTSIVATQQHDNIKQIPTKNSIAHRLWLQQITPMSTHIPRPSTEPPNSIQESTVCTWNIFCFRQNDQFCSVKKQTKCVRVCVSLLLLLFHNFIFNSLNFL